MSRYIRLDDEVLGELVEAARWYEERERGRGAELSDAASGRIETLNTVPNAGTPIWGVNGALLARQVRLQRYPYVVVHAVTEKEIRVVAIAHGRQRAEGGEPRHSDDLGQLETADFARGSRRALSSVARRDARQRASRSRMAV